MCINYIISLSRPCTNRVFNREFERPMYSNLSKTQNVDKKTWDCIDIGRSLLLSNPRVIPSREENVHVLLSREACCWYWYGGLDLTH